MAHYNNYYETEDLFGEPYLELIDFFKQYESNEKLIDLGCGKGRDSISLARFGYTVRGIDNSKVGIDQIISISERVGLKLTGLEGDIYAFDYYQDFDIVLLDSMFHYEKRDIKRETHLIDKIAKRINKNGLICVCIHDTGEKVRILKNTIDNTGIDFEILNDSSLIYRYEDKESGHISVTKYCIYIVRKK